MMVSMIRRSLAAVVATGLLLAACSSSDGSGDANATTTEFTLLPTTTTTPPTSTTSTTTTSTTSTTTSTTSTTVVQPTTTEPDPAVVALVLSGEGIGSAGFGADPDGVMSYVSSFLGEPTNDTGWIDPLSIGVCPGTELRLVSWGVLTLLFGDVSTVLTGRRHFVAYAYGVEGEVGGSPVGLVTTRDITVGSRVVDVVAAYPAATLNPEDDFTAPFFYVNDNLRGFLTGLSDDSTVTAILGGMNCGI